MTSGGPRRSAMKASVGLGAQLRSSFDSRGLRIPCRLAVRLRRRNPGVGQTLPVVAPQNR